MTKFDALSVAKKVLTLEAKALAAMSDALSAEFSSAVELIQNLKGRTILAGVGKSGHVARKIAATMASTGTNALFVHPTEASHGDMGMITEADAVIALSRSGETKELADLIGYCKRFAIPLIAITAYRNSTLGKAAGICLTLPDMPEACEVTGAPTTSTTLQMALGDALAVALLEAKGFTAGDFRTFHPGGTLGAQLATARDLMHVGERLPLTRLTDTMTGALTILSEKGFGCVGITDDQGRFCGMITDGDIRRNLGKDLPNMKIAEVMTKTPKTARPEMLGAEILNLMTAAPPKVMQVFIIEDEKPVGILHMHDLLRVGIA